MKSRSFQMLHRAAPLLLVLLGALFGAPARAADTLANAPLFTSSIEEVKPNILFVMDNSGSMDWDYLPQAAGNFDSSEYGKTASQCNGLAYNPDVVYAIPVDHDGVERATPSVSGLGNPKNETGSQRNLDGTVQLVAAGTEVIVTLQSGQSSVSYETGSTVTVFDDDNPTRYYVGTVKGWSSSTRKLTVTVTLLSGTAGTTLADPEVGKGSPKSPVYYKYTGTQSRLGFTYINGVVDTNGTLYKECNSDIGSTPGRNVFTAVTVTPLSTEAQNYVNWATYYQTRMDLMKAAVSHAFKDVNDRYRVGYVTINDFTNAANFLDVNDFVQSTHKKSFYEKFWGANPNGGTPLRGALARAGQYYAKKLPSQSYDPVQYSCQRNFTILSTDGYWNTGTGIESSTYGPYKLDGTTKVGQQDGALRRPMRDGATYTKKIVDTWDQTIVMSTRYETPTVLTEGNVTVKTTPRTTVERRTAYARGNSCGGGRRYWYEYRQENTITSSTIETTITNRVVTESKLIEPVQVTEVWTVQRTTNEIDEVVYPPEETRTLKSRTEAPLGPSTTDAGSPTPMTDVTTTSQSTPVSDMGDWQYVGVSCRSTPTNTPWTVGGSTTGASTVSGPDPYSDTQSQPRVLAAAPASRTVTDGTVTTTTSTTTSGGQENTLADVAAYYYQTDLRSASLGNCTGGKGIDVCADNVPGAALDDAYRSYGDSAAWQHMTTFTLGLGVDGVLDYTASYLSARTGHFHEIVTGQRNWPGPKEASGTESWPANIDDLWHAAVNGRGQYFNANDPASLRRGLSSALEAIKSVTGSASAASTSSLQPVAGDNDVYLAQFTTQEWTGDLLAFTIDPESGQISDTPTWSAKTVLDSRSTARTIYYAKPGAGLEEFTYTNLSAAGLAGHFDNFCSKTTSPGGPPDQCATLGGDLAAANSGANLVSYLRGTEFAYYRARASRLGDIINASPLFVGKPRFRYEENDYPAFAAAKASRQAVVLTAANDGMLHAFRRSDGVELWSFIPSAVLGNLHRLADTGYAGKHTYFVDGSPQMGDIYHGGQWRTIVVGGLNKGGRSYYALDLTDPTSPQLLWEFTHDNLGYTYGNPIITKREDGTWVVVFGSGYENVSPGDGNGHLFVLNAYTGALLETVSTFTDAAGLTPAGNTTTYSGLAKINAWVDSDLVNKARRFYGGDLRGNLWRFDIDNQVEPHGKALLLAQLRDPSNQPQPITVRPVVAEVDYNGSAYPVVYVGTGSYLRDADPSDPTVQSMYAIKDPLTATGYGNPRTDTGFVVHAINAGADSDNRPTRKQEANPPTVNWATHDGWRVDFPVGGERVSVNPQLAIDTLFVGTNLPRADVCTVGGDSFLYSFNITTGSVKASYVGNVLIMGVTPVQLISGPNANSIVTIITTSKGELVEQVNPPTAAAAALRRTSWRELVD